VILRLSLAALALSVPAIAQKVEVVAADPVFLPGTADSNSPMHWADGKRFVHNSDGQPVRSEGVELGSLRYAKAAFILNGSIHPWWLEATYRDDDGTIFGWYHHEIYDYCPMDREHYMGVPAIGAVVSKDNGRTFTDLGFVLMDGNEANCEAKNGYFASGHGDFTVVPDRKKRFFYFHFSTYGGAPQDQGVAVARMAFDDRFEPVGRVFKYHEGRWDSDGLFGRLTPIHPVSTPWESEFTDAFWGPSVHFNRELGEYVMLLNRACCSPGWPPEGIYISFNTNPANPKGWTTPERIIEGGGWYPMAVGLDPGDTDKEAGAVARLFMGSDSHHELVFHKGQQGIGAVSAKRVVKSRSGGRSQALRTK